MKIHGLQKLTLLDYPEKMAATLFLGGCNFRCPFCHNSGLVLSPKQQEVLPVSEVLAFLEKRRGILEGVCITGGEPTLSGDLKRLITDIRGLGYLVKLDTNGSRPEVLKELVSEGLLDYAAMDIKSSLSGYEKAAGLSQGQAPGIRERVAESAAFLMENHIPYEFRTTVVKELHSTGDFREIARWLAGCSAYYLQAYRDSESVLLPNTFHSYTLEELEDFRAILRETIPLVEIRGIV